MLDLEGAEVVEQAAETMLKRIAEAMPQARLQGFTVQAMCRRPQAEELILGMVTDAQFGPVMLFGQGGTAVEVIRSEEHTSELQSLMRISYAVFCLNKNKQN